MDVFSLLPDALVAHIFSFVLENIPQDTIQFDSKAEFPVTESEPFESSENLLTKKVSDPKNIVGVGYVMYDVEEAYSYAAQSDDEDEEEDDMWDAEFMDEEGEEEEEGFGDHEQEIDPEFEATLALNRLSLVSQRFSRISCSDYLWAKLISAFVGDKEIIGKLQRFKNDPRVLKHSYCLYPLPPIGDQARFWKQLYPLALFVLKVKVDVLDLAVLHEDSLRKGQTNDLLEPLLTYFQSWNQEIGDLEREVRKIVRNFPRLNGEDQILEKALELYALLRVPAVANLFDPTLADLLQ